jgi:N12 class adenine-specific DNA methylase
VAQSLYEPAVGLFHEVGAGKTACMVMAVMEKQRLGLVRKPVIVVPNHMLEQFAREWQQLYPQARLLAASKDDLSRERRREFVARCATNHWDAVIMTRSAFERVPVSAETERAYLEVEVQRLDQALGKAREGGQSITLKRMEALKMRRQERLTELLDTQKDLGITFEQLGIDHVVVDEAHAYKNLSLVSSIPGMAIEGSQRASDLHQKIWYLREVAKVRSVVTFATATPIANSISEAYTMTLFLRPDVLADAGIAAFDQWAATFGKRSRASRSPPMAAACGRKAALRSFTTCPS